MSRTIRPAALALVALPLLFLASAVLLAGGAPAVGGAGEVVVYSARHYGQEKAFEEFTKQTGIQVRVFNGNTAELFERLKAEGDRTPADVLLTVDAGNLWNAARAGLLAKVDSPEIGQNIPGHLRDPENRWVGLTVRARTIMYNTKKVKPEELSTYEALGDPKWKGRLCLRTSSYIYNQSFVATMIKRQGEAKTEEMVRALRALEALGLVLRGGGRWEITGGKQKQTCDNVLELADTIQRSAQSDVDLQRYKGLGEMDAEQLWESTMDPSRRTLYQVSMEDAISADEIFTVLMSDGVEARREYIEQHALEVTNLDV